MGRLQSLDNPLVVSLSNHYGILNYPSLDKLRTNVGRLQSLDNPLVVSLSTTTGF